MQRRRPLRQYWARNPGPAEAVGGSIPDLRLVEDRRPAEVFSDEIDPRWADPGQAVDEPPSPADPPPPF